MGNLLCAQDTRLVASLLEVLLVLWRSIHKALLQNKEAYQYTVAKFSSVISKYFQTFQRCVVPLVLLASLMPPAAVPTFSCGVLSKLKQMGVCAGPLQFGQLLDCVCGWGRTSQVLELLTRWLSLDTPPDKAPDRRRVRIQEEVEAKPGLALSYLEYLLGRSSTREHLLLLTPASLAQLHTTLGAWSEVLYSSLSSGAADRTDTRVQVALKAFTLQGRLAAHLHHASRLLVMLGEHLLLAEAAAVLAALLAAVLGGGGGSVQFISLRSRPAILGYCRLLPVVGRLVDIVKEIKDITTDHRLARTFFSSAVGNTCFYGQCSYYCSTEHAVCGRPAALEGSLAAMLPDLSLAARRAWRSPWRRSYSRSKRAKWETEADYCSGGKTTAPYDKGMRLVDFIDLAILDYLMKKGYLCIPLVLSVLKEVTEHSVPEENQEESQGSVLLAIVTNTFQKVVELLARQLRKHPEEGRELCGSATPGLLDFLQVVQAWENLPGSPLQGVYSTLFAGVIVEIRHQLQKVHQISFMCFL
ncbi:hypothetical protein CRUP_020609 [Coryphaenoides rupestris]|nr:hypothetical protein CRUP_020609 [Coryphaenoides rupestris]